MDSSDLPQTGDLEKLVTEIVSSYVKRNPVAPADLRDLITAVHQSLQSLVRPPETKLALIPAVSILKSVRPEYVVCLECGKRAKTLRRHISAIHDLTPEAYKAKWSLDADHPLTAPGYSDQRSAFAKQIGLGNRRRRATEGDAASTQPLIE